MSAVDEALAPRGHLFVCSGPDTGATLGLADEETTLGRAAECDIQVADGRASSAHARILRSNGHHVLLDLGSTNGTFVNSRRVEEVILQPGDVIQVGETLLEYRSDAEADAPMAEVSSSALAFPARWQQGDYGGAPPRPDARFAGHTAGYLPGAPEAVPIPPTPPDPADAPIDLVALFKRLRHMSKLFLRHWYVFVGVAALGAVIGLVWHHFDPGARRAVFTISLVPTANDSLSGSFNRNNSLVFFREAERNFKSERLIRETLKDMGNENPGPGFIEVVQNVLLTFDRQGRKSDVFSGSFMAYEADYAVKWLETHLDNYLETEFEKALRMVKTSERYFASELEKAKKRAETIDKRLVEFRRDHSNTLSMGNTSLYDDLFQKKERLREVERLIAQEERALSVERSKLSSTPKFDRSETLTVNPYLPQIAEIESELAAAAAAGKGPRHPDVVELKNRLAQIKRLSEKSGQGGSTGETRMTINQFYVQTRAEIGRLETLLARYKEEAKSLRKEIEESSEDVDVLPQQEATYKELLAEKQNIDEEVDRLSFKLKEARQQVELERSSAEARYDLILAPTLEYVDEKARTQKAGMKGMLGGLALALVLVSYLLIRRGEITLEMLTTIPRKQPRTA